MDRHGATIWRGGSVDKNLIHYREYVGRVEFDEEAGIFHGEVINLQDVITFEGDCVADLRQAMIDSVEDYLAFCAEQGREPEKPFSGKFLVRIDPGLHRRITLEAKKQKVSLNQLVSEILHQALS
jgi:predicted HicB family RNase H-like nuclease